MEDLLRAVNELPSLIPRLIFGFNYDFAPLPGTRPITTLEAIAPLATYYAALLLLFPSRHGASAPVRLVRLSLALTSAWLFRAISLEVGREPMLNSA
jgi:hypothetical protein